jgi:hypothetical protein
MSDMLQKLAFFRNLSLEEGIMSVYGSRIQILPSEMLAGFIYYGHNSQECAKAQYRAAKNSTIEYIEKMAKPEEAPEGKQIRFAYELLNELGWGKSSIKSHDIERGRAVIEVDGSSVGSTYLKSFGKSEKAVCHLHRGGIAGGAIALSGKKDVIALEMECIAKGDEKCVFVCGPKKELMEEYGKLIEEQPD